MRKQIVTGMILLILLILPLLLYLQINQNFQVSVNNARESADHEETLLARLLSSEILRNRSTSNLEIRNTVQNIGKQYGYEQMQILFYKDRVPVNGVLSEDTAFLLDKKERTSYLSDSEEALYIVHPLDEHYTLITRSDFSVFYQMLREQTAAGIRICIGGLVIAAVLSLLISGRITRRLRILSRSADAVRSGSAINLEPSAKKDEIGKLTNTFIAMNDAIIQREENLREDARQRQALIDALAHEMRTPLTSIVSAARLIQKGGDMVQMREEMCDLIVKESQRLAEMDENLMKLTRMHSAELKTETFSLLEMAQEALAVTPDAVLTGEDSTVTADRDLIIHLMRNLVNNAIKSGTLTPVRVTLHPRGFSVSDEGRGMTPEEVSRCTEAFWKADPARTRASGGAGLGLTLCQNIARLHGTELVIRSTPGKGTTVEFTLPLHPVEDSET
ncbi:HAMP domain-containing histidine kinase [Clostridiales bacterium FE2011]|nr:HAMP domain-containing histidine kinase [Clostridiales bacterium FE2011]QTE73877.1 HAMP domain-containing histidine kinase [Clostridiales bacterium FE2010]